MEKVISEIFDRVYSGVTATMDFLQGLFEQDRITQYDAHFLKETELLSKRNKGFCFGKRGLTITDSFSNAVCIGNSSSGKSSCVLLPSIFRMCGGSSLVINDPGKDLYKNASGMLADADYDVKCYNLCDPSRSEGFNFFERMSGSNDVAKTFKLIGDANGPAKGDPFWMLSAQSLGTFAATYLLKYCEPRYRNLTNVVHFLNTLGHSSKKLDARIARTNDKQLISEYKTFLSYPPNTLTSIIAQCKSNLSFVDETVGLVSAFDTINFDDFRKRKTALFIHSSISDARYYGVATSLLLTQFWGHIMSRIPDESELPIFFLLDEAASLTLDISLTISNIRKHRAGILLVLQSQNQLQQYGAAAARNILINANTKCYMPGVPAEVARELEVILGKFEWEDESGRHLRNLRLADEIRCMEEAILLIGNHRAIKSKLVPYYKQPRMWRYSQMPPVEFTNKLPFTEVPLIDFDAE